MKSENSSKYEKRFSELSDREVEAIKLFQDMLDQAILDIKQNGNFSNQDMYDMLGPFLGGAIIMSRICPNKSIKIKDRRHVNLRLMVAMRRVFDISIDDLIDRLFQSQNLPPRTPPQK